MDCFDHLFYLVKSLLVEWGLPKAPGIHGADELHQRENTRRDRVLLPLDLPLHEPEDELLQDLLLDGWVLPRHQVDDPGNQLLFGLELVLGDVDIVLLGDQQWLDEPEQLVNDCLILEYLVQIDHGLADLGGDLALFRERQVLHQVRVLVHREDREAHGLKGHREELDDVFLAIVVEVRLVLSSAETAAGLEDLVNVVTVLGVASKREV